MFHFSYIEIISLVSLVIDFLCQILNLAKQINKQKEVGGDVKPVLQNVKAQVIQKDF